MTDGPRMKAYLVYAGQKWLEERYEATHEYFQVTFVVFAEDEYEARELVEQKGDGHFIVNVWEVDHDLRDPGALKVADLSPKRS